MLDLKTIQNHFVKYDAMCSYFGIEIAEVDEEHSVTFMPMDQRHLNGAGSTHGAAIFAQVDVTFAALANGSGIYCTNVQTSMSFLAPGKKGPLRCVAKIIRTGRKLDTYEVRLTDALGTLVAIATVTGYNTGKPLPIDQ